MTDRLSLCVLAVVVGLGPLLGLTSLVHAKTPTTTSAPASQPTTAKAPELDLGNGIKIKLVLIPAGTFVMGSTASGSDPPHHVTLTKPYYMGIYTVTQEQYEYLVPRAKVRREKLGITGDPQSPEQGMSWEQAVAFCKLVSKRTGNTVRLPTEAEWEYACRAGTTTKYFFGDRNDKLGDYDWCSRNCHVDGHPDPNPRPVGQKRPNPWGLYDMYGNAPQWCSDFYGGYSRGKQVDPTGPKIPPPSKVGRYVTRGAVVTSLSEGSAERWSTGQPNKEGGPECIRVVVEVPLVVPKDFIGVFKVAGLSQGKYLDVAVRTAKVTPMPDGAGTDLVIPNKASVENPPDPVEAIYKVLEGAGKDDLLKIKYSVLPGNHGVISLAEPYQLKQGEDEPNVYIFSIKTTQKLPSGNKQPVIVVTRYLQESQFLVPMRLAAGDQRVPDPAMMKVIDTLKEGDSIEVKLEAKNSIKSIALYKGKR